MGSREWSVHEAERQVVAGPMARCGGNAASPSCGLQPTGRARRHRPDDALCGEDCKASARASVRIWLATRGVAASLSHHRCRRGGGQNGLPPEYEVWVDRADTDERALELVGRLEVAGLLTGLGARGSRSETARLAEVADSLWPQFDVGCRSPDAAPSYARSFAEDEVLGVVQALEREGIRGLRVHGWRVEPPVSSNPYYDGMGFRQRDHEQLLELVVHGKDNRELPFGVRLWSCIPLPLHLPEGEWPAWALESKAMIEREVAEQEWQHREQIHAHLEEFDAEGTAEA